jgi:hypothetical protein
LIVHGLPAILYTDEAGTVNAQFSLSLPDKVAPCTDLAKARPTVTDLEAKSGYPISAEVTVTEVASVKPLSETTDRDYTLKITKVWDTGAFKAKLKDREHALYSFHVVRSRANFGLVLDTTTAIHSFSGFVQIPLKNPEPVTYSVKWGLKAGDMDCHPFSTELEPEIKGLSSATINCWLPLDKGEWFRSGFLKADTRSAVLSLESIPKSGTEKLRLPPQPHKELPVLLSIAFYDEMTQDAVNMLWLLIVLLTGGVISLLLGAGVANTLRRVKIRNRLKDVDARTRRLPGRMDPELAVAMKVESRRIRELAGSQLWFSPDAGDSLTQAEAALTRLEARADVVAAMIPLLHTIHSPLGGGLAPSRIIAVEAKCHQVVQLLTRSGASDADLGNASTLINDCKLAVDKNTLKDDAFSQDILAREAALRQRLLDTTVQPATIKSPFQAAYNLWKAPFDGVLAATDPLDPMEYAIRDLRAVRLALLVEFISLGSASGPSLADIIAALQNNSWDGVRRARLLVAEALDGITVAQIEQALTNGDVEIVLSHDKPNALDSVTLSLCFFDASLNGAAVRRRFWPQWKFGHSQRGGQQPYSAEAWEVRHFFPLSRKTVQYEVEVAVPGITITAGQKTPVFQRKFVVEGRPPAPGRRFWLELARTASLMVMGAVVLQKSAQALLASSGIWTVALGILASGFTIDTLKSGIDGIRSKL